jgi:cytochrome c peroxidase
MTIQSHESSSRREIEDHPDLTIRNDAARFDRRNRRRLGMAVATVAVAAACAAACAATAAAPADRWSASELDMIRSLWLGSLEPLPPDPTNRYGDDAQAVALGHHLFFDPRLSSNGRVSCATCHIPQAEFQDGTALAVGVGTTDRRTMPIAGMAYSPWQFWDGRTDSQWAQALGPLESPVEHGGTRAQYVHLMAEHYREQYEALFGPLPDRSAIPAKAGPVGDPEALTAWQRLTAGAQHEITRVYANIGKAIAAYERRIQYGPSRFDRYAESLLLGSPAPESTLTRDEVAGLRLFIGKAQCTNCHSGALFTNHDFHNTGVPAVMTLPPDMGRARGARQVLEHEFNCRSRYSDARPEQCVELEFLLTDSDELVRAFKTPSLRNVAERPPYMHAGQLATLAAVVDHYNRAPEAPQGHTELRPLGLTQRERMQLAAFLRALSGPIQTAPELLAPPRD